MSYVVLARKYRPQSFGEMSGQEHVVRTISNALERGQLAHAFLFTGPRGVGKKTTARLVAKALNCEKGPTAEPCGVCTPCVEIAEGRAVDVIEIHAASNNGVDNVRDIVEAVKYRPARDRFKIFIVDEVHMLSTGAFNALLKTLEEPPEHVKFVLATTDVHKVPETIDDIDFGQGEFWDRSEDEKEGAFALLRREQPVSWHSEPPLDNTDIERGPGCKRG